ncbi:Lrp/AsnC family transcriptional regulator [Mucilaginibacter sp. dw_454]|uniref:Lrp/AsnC family transcriptional regulator n=1 Tax=Mucilaginibacter sp. dw_454 TaxID=2720079 RepID=UPI001BD6B785|nr:Lrp/AsnC family transcriptional regulator [Mucilaginibacter sp. dw_454]
MLDKLDQTDIRILQILQDNARLTNKEIGERLFKSASTINDRIRRMQDKGYIKKYVAVLEPKMIGRGFTAFTHVHLKDHSKEIINHFEEEIIKLPEVLECYHMSGQYDFILKVAVADLDAYHRFLMNNLFEKFAIGSIESTFVMREAKAEMPAPMPS